MFTPAHILSYQEIIQKKNYMQDPDYVRFFFKSISSDGAQVTVPDMRRLLAEFKMDESLAEEYVERTAGLTKAKSFTLEQFTEVLSGQVRP